MRPLILLLAVVALGCTRASKPAPQHPVNTARAISLDRPVPQSITEHPDASERASEFSLAPNPFVTPGDGAEPCQVDNTDHRAEELRAYITDFMSSIRFTRQYRRRYPAALSYIPIILDLVDADAERNPELQPLDHILIGVTIAYESSWDHEVIGEQGERGYMQVHGLAAGTYDDDDLDDPSNQLDAGIRHLRRAVELCNGDLRGALTMYGTGKRCRPYLESVTKYRWPAYLEAVAKVRKEKNHGQTTCAESGGER